MGTDIKAGDRVRVVIEGVVSSAHDTGKFRVSVGGDEGHDEGGSFAWVHPDTATVEKIEPPVEVFKPGDRVRHRHSEFEVTVGEDGYLLHHTTGDHSWFPKRYDPTQFTSKWYDRVYPG